MTHLVHGERQQFVVGRRFVAADRRVLVSHGEQILIENDLFGPRRLAGGRRGLATVDLVGLA